MIFFNLNSITCATNILNLEVQCLWICWHQHTPLKNYFELFNIFFSWQRSYIRGCCNLFWQESRWTIWRILVVHLWLTMNESADPCHFSCIPIVLLIFGKLRYVLPSLQVTIKVCGLDAFFRLMLTFSLCFFSEEKKWLQPINRSITEQTACLWIWCWH